jgi:hypothetical protein
LDKSTPTSTKSYDVKNELYYEIHFKSNNKMIDMSAVIWGKTYIGSSGDYKGIGEGCHHSGF